MRNLGINIFCGIRLTFLIVGSYLIGSETSTTIGWGIGLLTWVLMPIVPSR